MDRELYLAVPLQNAAEPEFRWDPASGELPSAFFARVDPTELGPTVNTTVALPTFPDGSLAEPTALWATRPGDPVWRRVNAMSAWQNTLYPPTPPLEVDAATRRLGREVFERAGCHGRPSLSEGRIVAVPEIGTQPARADALQSNERTWSERALAYGFGQTAPFEGEPRVIEFPTGHLDPEQVRFALASGSPPAATRPRAPRPLLVAPPYLHDGGVAVGPQQGEAGLPDTVFRFLRPDAHASLQALVDRELRARVVAANKADPRLELVQVTGEGHRCWVDEQAGFTLAEQRALVRYLLSHAPEPGTPLPRPAPPPPLLPAPDAGPGLAGAAHDPGRAYAVGGQDHDLGPPDMLLWAAPVHHDRFETSSTVGAALTSTMMPFRIPQVRIPSRLRESPTGLFRQT